jgi:dimethylaniline monooxygenase (N-oxide forming)
MGNTLDKPQAQTCPPSGKKKHVCVIGSGASGLIVMKELTALGHTVECFELLPTLGGVYVKSYQSTILTTSSLLTAWSDYSDGKEACPKFWTAEEYLDYMTNFAKVFNLFQYINFSHKVTEVKKCGKSGKWIVTVVGGQGCENIERCRTVQPNPNAKERTIAFDAVAICTGTNTYSSLPSFPGQERFKGEIIHSDKYRNPDAFVNKRVLVVGAGESGSDITNEISMVAAKCAIAIRGKHGHLIPRIQGNGRVTDLNTNRARYSNPYIFGDWVGYVNQMAKKAVASTGPDSDLKKVLRKIGELNMKQGTSAFSKFGCKNEGFVAAMVLRGAELHRDTFELHENKAVFKDGSEFECDAIVACTGYKNCFPMFDEHHPEISFAGSNPRTNFKQVFCVAHPGEIAFFGFARPAFGSIPPCVEMQARYFSLVVNGEIPLPDKDEMTRVAKADQADWEYRFGNDAHRVKGLVDFQLYCDSIARQIGVMPPLAEIFFKKPSLWLKIMFGPFTMHQYRLVGPYANPARAEEVYSRQPLGDFLESSITICFLIVAKILYTLGFQKFKPNEW